MPPLVFIQPNQILRRLKKPHPQYLNHAFMDPYQGCEMGCVYCYGVREEMIIGRKDPSPFRVGVKTSSLFALQNELKQPLSGSLDVHRTDVPPPFNKSEEIFSIGIGYETEPYQSCEKQFQLTQRALEIFGEKRIPVQIMTKSDLVLRDLQFISELSQKGLAIVTVSLFSLSRKLASLFEPKALPSQDRLGLIQRLRKENIVCGAALMPILPYLSDSEKELGKIFKALDSCGALYCVPGVLSLNQTAAKNRVFRILREHYPAVQERYHALYDSQGYPALNYCERIEKHLAFLSEKYRIPTVLPVHGAQEKNSLIVKDFFGESAKRTGNVS